MIHFTRSIAVGVVLVVLFATMGGCRQAATPESEGSGAAATGSKHKVTAYINVTSGCQQPTVDLLEQLGAQYKDKVEVEIIDFGSPEGAKKWQEAGLDCMTIQFDGKAAVSFPQGGVEKVVVFQMPAGFNWAHEDLVSAFGALVTGSLKPATEEQIAELSAPRLIEMEIQAQEVRDVSGQGKPYGQILVDNLVVARIYGKAGGQTPAQRARTAQAVIEKWLSRPILPSDLSVAQSAEGWGLYAGQERILLATIEDAKGYGEGMTPRDVAAEWLLSLRGQVLAAAGRARAEAQAKKAKEAEEDASDEDSPG